MRCLRCPHEPVVRPVFHGCEPLGHVRARDKARKALRDVKQRFDKLSDAYLVEAESGGTVITVGHRIQRIKN